ncbi:hypothetical protein NIES23_11920 [Trichormus variabilis NIES-23]|uniref:Uncharacterized protein n=1 Tax=Trichormus variabilis NIES-23 TaxID=1973479 RepID=A0A1Z4KHE5_ANAVA|nr:hypothetical protein NIES23_11920 [Trichormus variabilis NIES-23]
MKWRAGGEKESIYEKKLGLKPRLNSALFLLKKLKVKR